MSKPVLWHIPVSHYNEKVRWALTRKGIEHERRAPVPGPHMVVALWLTRGATKTFPVLQLDGEAIGDSTAIIEALERRHPEPALYPEDPDERRRALELEDYFDEVLGPAIRLLAWHELTDDHDGAGMEPMTRSVLPPALARIGPVRNAANTFGSAYVGVRYGVRSDERAARARETVVAALDRLESELGDREYLVGDRFTVADLTAASLFYPLAQPPEGPRVFAEMPAGFEDFAAPLRERPATAWVTEMFARHRR